MKANAYIRQLGPQEVAQRGFPPGTVVMQKPNGDVEVKQGGTAWTPKDVQDIRKGAMESQEMKQAKASLVAYDSLKRNTGGTMTGPQAYDILDTWIRTINPGAVARQGSIEAAMSEVGMPQTYLGLVQHLIGMGKLTPETQQAILDGVLPFVQGHWDQANAINQDNATAASRHGYDPRDITLPLDGRPSRYVIPGQRGGGPVQLDAKNADADYARLPPGAQFIGPDGKLRTKP